MFVFKIDPFKKLIWKTFIHTDIHSFIMQALLDEIMNLNRLMLPYLKQETYDEFMKITHNMISLFNEMDNHAVDKKMNTMIESLKDNAMYKSKFEEAESKIQNLDCEITLLRRELEIIRSINKNGVNISTSTNSL